MRKNFEKTVVRNDKGVSWSLEFPGVTRLLGGILLLALLLNPIPAFSITTPGASVTLAWDGSPSPEVTGYRVYYGAASGTYTNSVTVGNLTTGTVPGLTAGATYYMAVIAFDANGLESTFSNEISYTVPVTVPAGLHSVQLRMTPAREFILTVTGQIGRTYELLASPDLTNWTVIGAVTPGTSGSVDFTDTNAASFANRFYRTRDNQP